MAVGPAVVVVQYDASSAQAANQHGGKGPEEKRGVCRGKDVEDVGPWRGPEQLKDIESRPKHAPEELDLSKPSKGAVQAWIDGLKGDGDARVIGEAPNDVPGRVRLAANHMDRRDDQNSEPASRGFRLRPGVRHTSPRGGR